MRRQAYRRALAPLFAVAILASLPRPAAAAEPPAAVVESFQARLIEVMREAAALGPEGRYRQLLPAVTRAFNLPVMVRIATGRHWQAAPPEQRQRLVDAFRRMSVGTLATLFDGYNGEVFEIVGSRDGPQGTRLVHTKLVTGSGKRHDITYVAHRFPDGWRLIDVIVDNGISELKVRQSEYHQVLRREGVDGLIRLLNGKADELIALR